MKIQSQAIDSLIPYEFNNKKHEQTQIDRIANSIQQFGFNQPLVIDENNIILVGHGRLLAAKKLGLAEVPTLTKSGLTELQKKAYRILDNKLSNDADWDSNNLELEIGLLEDEGFPIKEWGLDELCLDLGINQPEAAEDDFNAEPPKESFLKLGDLLELGRHRVLCGDCTDGSSYSLLMMGKKSDFFLCDPPYNIKFKSQRSNKSYDLHNDDLSDDEYLQFSKNYLDCLINNSLGKGVITCGKQNLKMWLENFQIEDVAIWIAKNKMSGSKISQLSLWEPILFLGDFDRSLMASDLYEFNCKKQKDADSHPCPKTIEFFAEILKVHCKTSVIDCFLGSGTTLIACEQLNRTCYGLEISPNYCEVILNRYAKYCLDNNKPVEIKINGESFDYNKYKESLAA